MTKVAEEAFPCGGSAHIAAGLLDLRHSAQSPQRRGARFLGAHPQRNVLCDLGFEMKADLVFKFPLCAGAEEERPKAETKLIENAHKSTPRGRPD